MVRVGQYKTFGAIGPVYQVLATGRNAPDGEWMIPIRVIETGEELDYRYSRFVQDPDAR
jgi:hypothetical protein